jgi:hypothetical protein
MLGDCSKRAVDDILAAVNRIARKLDVLSRSATFMLKVLLRGNILGAVKAMNS